MHKPNKQDLVLRGAAIDRAAIERDLDSLDTKVRVEALDHEDAVYLIRFEHAQEDPKALWHQVVDQVDPSLLVSPVLDDDEGEPHYPTGSVTVRFGRAVEDDELRGFADRHQLELAKRNRWVPEQVVLRPRSRTGMYLPDVIERLAAEPDIVAAWANTEARYRRADR